LLFAKSFDIIYKEDEGRDRLKTDLTKD